MKYANCAEIMTIMIFVVFALGVATILKIKQHVLYILVGSKYVQVNQDTSVDLCAYYQWGNGGGNSSSSSGGDKTGSSSSGSGYWTKYCAYYQEAALNKPADKEVENADNKADIIDTNEL
eukprot:4864840-Ditylum_brightwellii.AAC.1